ncbi:hypothetical protein PACTADRAFT_48617 [Pachysolen tannophilus NRRL Y-2460]|uniref:Imidazole glycerol phosphate synthase hisHF n=1 Tax=Pachysolen tannophilus NRRL Y-2460 TaxID=669874 RepID=A0A1E4TYI5_PACTA|nr:hypothetical protein PACTADRAFT_48617 [Pachysolen tannophilus NRRL Y-2460]
MAAEEVVHIIDVESGNLRSLQNAIEYLGYKVQFISNASEFKIDEIEKLFLPGVGNFGHFVDQIRDRGFVEPIKSYIESGKPIMGICVGLQALFNGSEESPGSKGLGIIDSKLSKFDDSDKSVPHIGWNSLQIDDLNGVGKTLYGLNPNSNYYFVHSYAAIISKNEKSKLINDQNWELATGRYGNEEFIAAVVKDNVFATQFHPEKSGTAGLKIIRAFLEQQKFADLTSLKESNVPEVANTEHTFTGLSRRVVACLDVRTNDQGDLVVTKGDQYDVREKSKDGSSGDVVNLGKPVELAQKYYEQGADEITFLNITSFRNSPLRDAPMLQVLKKAAKTIFVPLTVGGGIKDVIDPDGTKIPALDVATMYFRSGADKVSIGSDAVIAAENFYKNNQVPTGESPMETISKPYGVQAVVISVDPKRFYINDPKDIPYKSIRTSIPGPNGEQYCYYKVTSQGGRKVHDLGAWELCYACERLGAGEILLNCIDKDGSNSGYDLELIDFIKTSTKLPVIASSGAGKPEHFEEVFKNTKTDAALGAGMFHRGEYTVRDVKLYLKNKGLQVRIDDEEL